MERDENAFIIRGEQTVLRLEPLTNEDVRIAAEDVAGEGRHGEKDWSMFTVRLSMEQSQWRNAVALSWAMANEKPVKVILHTDGDIWTFATGDRAVVLNWTTGEAKMQ